MTPGRLMSVRALLPGVAALLAAYLLAQPEVAISGSAVGFLLCVMLVAICAAAWQLAKVIIESQSPSSRRRVASIVLAAFGAGSIVGRML